MHNKAVRHHKDIAPSVLFRYVGSERGGLLLCLTQLLNVNRLNHLLAVGH